MAHAEKCPICGGRGIIQDDTCHGCKGKGWVEVGDAEDNYLVQQDISGKYHKVA